MELEGREIYYTNEPVPDLAEEMSFIQGGAIGRLDPMSQREIYIRNDPVANANSIVLKAGLPSIDTIIETKLIVVLAQNLKTCS